MPGIKCSVYESCSMNVLQYLLEAIHVSSCRGRSRDKTGLLRSTTKGRIRNIVSMSSDTTFTRNGRTRVSKSGHHGWVDDSMGNFTILTI